MRLALVLAAFASLAISCASSGATGGGSGLTGRVMRGPITPVCHVNVPCSAPAKGVTLVFSRGASVAGRAKTNSKGWYRIALRPGRYSVRTTRKSFFESRPHPSTVTVPKGRFARRDLELDTGLR